MRNRIAALAVCALILTSCTAIDDGTAVPADGTMPTLPPLTETTTEETTTVTETETTTETTTEETTETETESETEGEETTAAASMSSSEYKEHFSDSLFIGDSITVGFSAYGYIGENNVAAKVGLNPSSALTKEIEMPDGSVKTVSARAAELQPKNVYIMLGSNGIQWLSNESMLGSVSELSAEIKSADPDCSVYLLSIPPVTEVYNNENEGDIMSRINDYNAELKNIAAQNGCGYIDITTPLQDSTGYFAPDLAEKDGIHFKGRCYTLVLDEIIKNS